MSAVVPYSVTGKASTQMQVTYQGQNSNTVAVPATTVAPGIFTTNASGSGPGAIVIQSAFACALSSHSTSRGQSRAIQDLAKPCSL